MTTLTALKAEVADDLARTDLTSQIATAITAAITFYKPYRFYFTESRTDTFITVEDQSTYSSSDDTDIPLFAKLDAVFLTDSDSNVYQLRWCHPTEIELSLDTGASTSRPTEYTYFGKTFRFYPIPDASYTIRPMGVIEKAAPATDGEADNVWMTDGYQLIKARAKSQLYRHVIRQLDKAQDMEREEQMELTRLRGRGAMMMGSGIIQATQF